ncbi:MAG: PKD domain-containing protein [Flavobacteriales bacterium]|jgi:PKD repeat protein|nr:PKD domain-containing protein [Flavobacteriales bacterium]
MILRYSTLLSVAFPFMVAAQNPCDSLVNAFFTPVLLQGNTYAFNNGSTSPDLQNTDLLWYFGDNTTSTQSFPTHTFQTGAWEICLTVTWQNCVSKYCDTLVVGVNNECDSTFEAGFAWTSVGNNTVLFDGVTNLPANWHWWNFGDGAQGFGDPTQHTYPQAGQYQVCYTAGYWNSFTQDTCTTTYCQWVVATGGGTTCDSLQACIDTEVLGQQVVLFNNCSSAPGQGTQYQWSFGDGSGSTDTSPLHTFPGPGTYTVCLIAYWQNCADSTCTTVVIGGGAGPCDSLNASFTAIPNGLSASFQSAVIDPQWSYHWYFGDGTQGFGPIAQHTYQADSTYQVCLVVWAYDPLTQDTCYADHCEWVTVTSGGSPCDSLQACFFPSGLGQIVFFNNCTSAPGQGTQYQWNFGDGSGSTDVSPLHTFPGPGTYNVCLIAYWQNCVDSICASVQIGGGGNPCDALTASWTHQETGGLAVDFAATVTYGSLIPAYLEWNFGDGSYAYTTNATHTFPGPDYFQVCLTVWGWDSLSMDTCMVTVCGIVDLQVHSPCDSLNASFTAIPNGLSASFQSAVIDPQWSYLWYFGDGSSGFGPIAQHTYPADSTYHVCLLVWAWDPLTQDTCFAEHCEWVTVANGGLPCDSLQACFVPSIFGQQVAFFNNCTSAPGQGTQYQWNFGDGSGSTDVSPTHTFPGPGTYNVCLIAYWQNCVDSTCTVVQIGGGSDPCDALTASWTHQETGPLTVAFDATVTYGSLIPAYLEWSFGDGTYAYTASATHTFPGPDYFQVCLTVWAYDPLSQDTCMLTVCGVVDLQVQSPCDSLNADFTAIPNGLSASFQSAVIDPLWSYQWYFGDGSSGFGPVAQHTYQADSTYHVCLVVWAWDPMTQDSCFAEHCEWVNVASGGSPCDSLQACFVPSAIGQQALFFNNCTSSPGQGVQYQWNFGDGSGSTDVAPLHTFPAPGVYTICLTAYWENCVDSTCTQVVVPGQGSPCDSLSANFSLASNGSTVEFASALVHPQWNYLWSFGDGTYDQGSNVTHAYPGGAVYNACLVVWAWDPLLQDTCFAEHCEEIDLLSTAVTPSSRNDVLVVWPVPFSTELHVRGSALLSAQEIRLTDPAGQLVWRELVGGRVEVDLSPPALASGVYLLEVRGDGRMDIRRLVRMP